MSKHPEGSIGVDELIKRLQGETAGVSDPEPVESSPVIAKRLAEFNRNQPNERTPNSPTGNGEETFTLDESLWTSLGGDLGDDELQDDQKPQRRPGWFAKLKARIGRFSDPINHDHFEDDGEAVAHWPKQIHIGFMTQVKKKDLMFHISEWVSDNASSKSSCFYQLLPFSGGYAYEIQEGGSGRGALKSALELVAKYGEVVVPSSERHLQLSLKQPGFSAYLLDESDQRGPSPELTFTDPLRPVFSRHHGLMVTGFVSAFFGLASLGAAWFLVYTVYDRDKVPVYEKARYELPSDQMRKVNDVMNQPQAYLERLTYTGGRWSLDIKQVAAPTEAQAAPLKNYTNEKGAEALSAIKQTIGEPKK